MVGQCELGKVRAKERAKDGSIRVQGSGDYLSDVVRAGKNKKECGKRENGQEAMRRDLVEEEDCGGRLHGCSDGDVSEGDGGGFEERRKKAKRETAS